MCVGGTLGSKGLSCHRPWNKWFHHKFILCSSGYVCVFFPFQILLSFMISHSKMVPLSFRNKVSLVHHQKWNRVFSLVTHATKVLAQGDSTEHWTTWGLEDKKLHILGTLTSHLGCLFFLSRSLASIQNGSSHLPKPAAPWAYSMKFPADFVLAGIARLHVREFSSTSTKLIACPCAFTGS